MFDKIKKTVFECIKKTKLLSERPNNLAGNFTYEITVSSSSQ